MFLGPPLLQELACPAVSPDPERAIGTGGSFVIDTLLVWAANDPVCHHDRLSSGLRDEREHLLRNIGIVANVAASGEPASQVRDVGIFSWHDGNSELRGRGIVWAVERDGRDGVAAESLLGSLAQPLACAFKHCSSSPRISCRAVGLLLYAVGFSPPPASAAICKLCSLPMARMSIAHRRRGAETDRGLHAGSRRVGHRTSRAAQAIDVMAAAPLVSATSLGR